MINKHFYSTGWEHVSLKPGRIALAQVECYRTPGGVRLEPVVYEAEDGALVRKEVNGVTIPKDAFEARDRAVDDLSLEARWALRQCGVAIIRPLKPIGGLLNEPR